MSWNFTNMTNWGQLPAAVNTETSGAFGIIVMLVLFFVPLAILASTNARTKPEDAISLSLFVCLIGSGIMVSLEALNPVAVPVILALLGLSVAYSFMRK